MGLSMPRDAVPTQWIIHFTAAPSAAYLPVTAQVTGASNERVAGIHAASAAATAEQTTFMRAAANITFRQDFVYKHVSVSPEAPGANLQSSFYGQSEVYVPMCGYT